MNSILNYEVIFRAEPDGGFTVNVPALQGCVTYGETLEEAEEMANEAIELYLESLYVYKEESLSGFWMSDFISLTCPHCGRVLPIADSTSINDVVSTIYTCDSCGVKSILKRDTSKFWLATYYAACPVCNNNDKSVRISTLDGRNPKIDLRQPVEPTKQEFVPSKFVSSFIPNSFDSMIIWGRREERPKLDLFPFIIGTVVVMPVIPCALVQLFASLSVGDREGIILGASVLALVAFAFLGVILKHRIDVQKYEMRQGKYREKIRAESLRKENFLHEEEKRRELVDRTERASRESFEKEEKERERFFLQKEKERMSIETARYERAVKHWNNSYYCGRDDVVFILGTNEYVRPDKFQEFLYR